MSFYVTLLVVLIAFELRKHYLKSSAHHDYLLLVHQIHQLSEIMWCCYKALTTGQKLDVTLLSKMSPVSKNMTVITSELLPAEGLPL